MLVSVAVAVVMQAATVLVSKGFGGQGQQFEFNFGDGGLGDIFGSFFGGSGQRQHQPTRGRDVETTSI